MVPAALGSPATPAQAGCSTLLAWATACGHIFFGTFYQPCLGLPTRVGLSLTLSVSLPFIYRKDSVNVTGQVGGRRCDVSRCVDAGVMGTSLASSGVKLPCRGGGSPP